MNKSFAPLLSGLILAFLLFLIMGWADVSAYATDAETQSLILYVKPGANGTCFSWADACELETALFNAVAGDQIWVAAGTYKPTTSTNRSTTFELISGVAIYGGFPAAGGEWFQRNWVTNLTTLSGDIGVVGDTDDNSYHVVTGSGVDATALLDGFTISGGNADGNSGGGMYNSASSPTLTNLTFSGNSAYNGGGMYNAGSNPTLSNVTFTNNSSIGANAKGGGMANYDSSPTLSNVTFSGNISEYHGGGMYNQNSSPILTDVVFLSNNSQEGGGGMDNSSSSPSLSNVTFSGNSADQGGGMFNIHDSSPSLTNVTFSDNTALDYGGGMDNYSSSPSLSNVTFSGNSADQGGGMYNQNSSSPSLSNVTFSGNLASHGGGMYNYNSSSPSLTNVTFTDNVANGLGGGLYNWVSNPTVTNSILWGNNPNQIYGSATVTYSDIQGGYAGTGNIDADPLLGPLADNGGFTQTHAIAAGSPAIDAGDPELCTDFDQRGFARPIDGDVDGTARCDMGSYEYVPNLYLPLIMK